MVSLDIDDKNKILNMAEDIFDLQLRCDSESLVYMFFQHARDCLLAIEEVYEFLESTEADR